MLEIAYHILRDGTRFIERGATFFDHWHAPSTHQWLTRRLERLGFTVTLVLSRSLPPKSVYFQRGEEVEERRLFPNHTGSRAKRDGGEVKTGNQGPLAPTTPEFSSII
jgi:hypothetical protein